MLTSPNTLKELRFHPRKERILRESEVVRLAFHKECSGTWAKVGLNTDARGLPRGCEDQSRTPVAAGEGMIERNKSRAFGIRGRREGERVKDDSQLSGLSSELLVVPLTERNTCWSLFFIFLSAVMFILRACQHCSHLSVRAVFQYKNNSYPFRREK